MKIELHEHQSEAVQKMHNGCVLWGDVGTGKTITALAYALLKEAGKNIVVITTAKKRDSWDWQNEAALSGVPVDGIEVESWNKIGDYVDRKDQFFIFDEQRLVGSGAWVKHFYKIAKANSWILLSATPGDTWSDYAPMFIANGWYKNVTEFRREHAVYSRFTQYPKIERYIGEDKLKRYRQQLLVKMPMMRHTTRHMIYLDCEWDQAKLDIVRKKRWNPFTDEPIKSAAEMFTAMRRIVSEDGSRRRQFEALLDRHPKMIVFYNFNYELEILRDILQKHQTSTSASDLSTSDLTLTSSETNSESSMSSINTGGTSSYDPGLRSLQKRIDALPTSLSSVRTKERTSAGSERLVETPCTKRTSTNTSTTKEDNTCPRSPATPSKSSSSTSARPFGMPSARTSLSDSTSRMTSTLVREPGSGRGREIVCVQSNAMTSSVSSTSSTSRSSRSSDLASSSTSPRSSSGSGSSSGTPTTPSEFAWSEWNGHKHEPIPATDRWVYLVQYTSGSEGWNCIDTNVMVFWSLTYSWKQWWQAQGRIDRMNTTFKDLYYYVLRTKSVAERPVIQSLEQKKDFQPK